MAAPSRDLPSFEQIWTEVCEYASFCETTGVKIFTLQRFVGNTIAKVNETLIKRVSDDGTSQSAHIRRSDVERVWTELCESEIHEASTKGDARVFTHALMLAAMPRRIEIRGPGTIGLVGREPRTGGFPSAFAAEETEYAWRARRGFVSGGEGDTHRSIRLYIHEHPNAALAGLAGGPWTSYATEYELATRDRIDVVVRDATGRFVLIEVKPALLSSEDREDARAPYAQAAKYRTQWQILRQLSPERLRCVVAAPQIPIALARTMARDHGVESVAVTLPTPTTGPG